MVMMMLILWCITFHIVLHFSTVLAYFLAYNSAIWWEVACLTSDSGLRVKTTVLMNTVRNCLCHSLPTSWVNLRVGTGSHGIELIAHILILNRITDIIIIFICIFIWCFILGIIPLLSTIIRICPLMVSTTITSYYLLRLLFIHIYHNVFCLLFPIY